MCDCGSVYWCLAGCWGAHRHCLLLRATAGKKSGTTAGHHWDTGVGSLKTRQWDLLDRHGACPMAGITSKDYSSLDACEFQMGHKCLEF